MGEVIGNNSPLRVVVIGAGGLAAPMLWGLLDKWPANMRLEVLLLDPDAIELSNLNRQVFFGPTDLGEPKALVLAERLLSWLPANSLNTVSITGHVTELELSNISAFAGKASLVVDACDSTETKFLINDYCVTNRIPFCYAGAVGTDGQFYLYNPGKHEASGCLRCLFGDYGEEDYRRQTTTCQAAGIWGPVVGYIGMLQGQLCSSFALANDTERAKLGGELHRFRFPELSLNVSPIKRAADCPLGCGLEGLNFLDLRSERCPATFLYTKLALERLPNAGYLDVRFGSADSVENVSTSVMLEGHSLMSEPRRLADTEWQVLIKKRPLGLHEPR